jgi:hypothetical protein
VDCGLGLDFNFGAFARCLIGNRGVIKLIKIVSFGAPWWQSCAGSLGQSQLIHNGLQLIIHHHTAASNNNFMECLIDVRLKVSYFLNSNCKTADITYFAIFKNYWIIGAQILRPFVRLSVEIWRFCLKIQCHSTCLISEIFVISIMLSIINIIHESYLLNFVEMISKHQLKNLQIFLFINLTWVSNQKFALSLTKQLTLFRSW